MMLLVAAHETILGHARPATDRAEERIRMSMATETKRWTLEEVHSLPDDGNTYELVHGDLLVTPPPSDPHETIAARLTRILDPYVATHDLGLVYRPKAVIRIGSDVQVEPDLMVRRPHPDPEGAWETAPLPILVVEILSGSTRRRDLGLKRDLYAAFGIPEYWVIDRTVRTILICRPGEEALTLSDGVTWAPKGTGESLAFELDTVLA
ncbi:MAG: Uma2 family endonuclease [Gemmatimonadaceae bacterium]